ncbi:MAG TPA: hypothetical protein VHY79_03790 [Rhizomicrobium sp.]|nr:hypothetical protein [Rhizomicrobium sp.]
MTIASEFGLRHEIGFPVLDAQKIFADYRSVDIAPGREFYELVFFEFGLRLSKRMRRIPNGHTTEFDERRIYRGGWSAGIDIEPDAIERLN